MKKILKYILLLSSSSAFACGGGWYEGMSFYSLFKQTNISATEFYPFLRNEYNTFYDNKYGRAENMSYPKGNISLWKEILVDWNTTDLENAIYTTDNINWSNKNSEIEKRAKIYIEFAQLCSDMFDYRNNINSWDYNEIKQQRTIDTEDLLSNANLLLSSEKNQQLKARYYYQIIRILHYSNDWEDAIKFYKVNIENKLPKNEIYYYITDQVAGCYYSTKNYNKAAYLFTKVLNKSIDRKQSAFSSYNFCTDKNAEGKPFFNSIDDEKDLLLITSLRNFSNEVYNINKFIDLDANDKRVELLFMRALSNLEEDVWPKRIGVGDKTLPYDNNNNNCNSLLIIAEQQSNNPKVENKDFWKIASSYLSFITQDINIAKSKLAKVNSFVNQKKVLTIVYEVFSWDIISSDRENYISKVLSSFEEKDNYTENDLREFVLDKIAHIYYTNGEIAKAFLIHHSLWKGSNIAEFNSLKLLNELETFSKKPNKNEYEKMLTGSASESFNFIDYINYQKGIYYLYDKNPELALEYFNKNTSAKGRLSIPNSIFSNNLEECFQCDASEIMDDEVYKADVFSFIKSNFSRKELAINLMELIKLTSNKKLWKAKLANYLLANYYYNISNTGYYRGLLNNNTNIGNYYINSSSEITSEKIIADKIGYNLYDVNHYKQHYFGLSKKAMKYYQNVIDLSLDKELNARCSYLMAKCELNDFYYNRRNDDKYYREDGSWGWKEHELVLPKSKSFKLLKEKYSDTKFHKMIIKECSYYRYYSAYHLDTNKY